MQTLCRRLITIISVYAPTNAGWRMRPYACGTGAVASAIISAHLGKVAGPPVLVTMRGGELKIDFAKQGNHYTKVWLMGPVDTVFTGEIIVRE